MQMRETLNMVMVPAAHLSPALSSPLFNIQMLMLTFLEQTAVFFRECIASLTS